MSYSDFTSIQSTSHSSVTPELYNLTDRKRLQLKTANNYLFWRIARLLVSALDCGLSGLDSNADLDHYVHCVLGQDT